MINLLKRALYRIAQVEKQLQMANASKAEVDKLLQLLPQLLGETCLANDRSHLFDKRPLSASQLDERVATIAPKFNEILAHSRGEAQQQPAPATVVATSW